MGLPWYVTPAVLFVTSLTLIIIAIVVPFKIEEQIDDTLAENFLFDTDSGEGWNKWVTNEKPGSSMGWVEVWLFNVTNPDETRYEDAVPIVNEIGPFYYRQYLRQVDPVFGDINGERVVTATPYIYLIFDRNQSILPDDTVITMPGLGYWGVMTSALVTGNPVYQQILYPIFGSNQWGQPFEQHTVNEWLFGYDDMSLFVIQQLTQNPSQQIRLALLRNQSSPEDAQAQVNTSTTSCGFPNPARFQQLLRWRGSEDIDFWDGEYKVAGSAGNFFGFKRSGQEDTELHFWSLIGRSVVLVHNATIYTNGIKTYRYRVDPKEFYNATLNAANAKFYQYKYNGLLNLTTVVGAPVFFSKGHFLDADPSLFEYIENMTMPDPAVDDIYIDVEPITGVAFVTYKMSQINIHVGALVQEQLIVNMTRQWIHPLIVVSQNSRLVDSQIADLKDALDFYDRAVVAEDFVLYGCSIIGCLLFLAAVWVAHHRREELRQGQTLLSDGEEIHLAYGGLKN